MCACTEPVRIGIYAVCVECGRLKVADYDVESRTLTYKENKKGTLRASHGP